MIGNGLSLVFAVVCASVMSACTAQPSLMSKPVSDETLGADYFAGQNRCEESWRELLNEWVEVGGGIRGSVTATREIIASDDRSRFSRIVRSVWELQESYPTQQQDGVRRAALAFSDASAGEVAEGCEAVVWLEGIIVEPPSLSAQTKAVLAEPLPFDPDLEPRLFARWLINELIRQ